VRCGGGKGIVVSCCGDEQHFHVASSEDTVIFTDVHLARYEVMVFLNTTLILWIPAETST